MVINRTRILLSLGVLAAATWMMPSLGASPKAPKKPELTFTQVVEHETYTLAVDKSTVQKEVDKQGDTEVGAIFRVTLKKPVTSESGNVLKSFVNGVVGICGFNGLILIQSDIYDPKGKLLGTTTKPQAYPASDEGNNPSSEMYKYLCKGIPRVSTEPPVTPTAPKEPEDVMPSVDEHKHAKDGKLWV